jgi:hypothetical protein
MPYHSVTSSASLSPGVAAQVVGANANRYELTIQNTGTHPATIGFGSAPAAGGGLTLDGASAAGGQGGARVWSLPAHIHEDDYYQHPDPGDAVPSQSIWAISTAGTTIVVIESLP